MHKDTVFLVVGGDFRQNFLAKRLADNGKKVYSLGLSEDFPAENVAEISSLSALKKLDLCPDVTVLPLIASNDSETVNAPFFEKKIQLTDLLLSVCPKAAF